METLGKWCVGSEVHFEAFLAKRTRELEEVFRLRHLAFCEGAYGDTPRFTGSECTGGIEFSEEDVREKNPALNFYVRRFDRGDPGEVVSAIRLVPPPLYIEHEKFNGALVCFPGYLDMTRVMEVGRWCRAPQSVNGDHVLVNMMVGAAAMKYAREHTSVTHWVCIMNKCDLMHLNGVGWPMQAVSEPAMYRGVCSVVGVLPVADYPFPKTLSEIATFRR